MILDEFPCLLGGKPTFRSYFGKFHIFLDESGSPKWATETGCYVILKICKSQRPVSLIRSSASMNQNNKFLWKFSSTHSLTKAFFCRWCTEKQWTTRLTEETKEP